MTAQIDIHQHLFPPAAAPADRAAQLLGSAPHIYAVLDAHRITNLPDMLAAARLPHACLFNADLAAQMPEQSPWLVGLRAEDKLLHQLLTPPDPEGRNPFAFWAAEAGIFLDTALPLDALRRHLRRFLRVQLETGALYFFRFWEPTIAAAYFSGLNDRPEVISRWLQPREGGRIDRLLIGRPRDGADGLIEMLPQNLPETPPPVIGAFQLSSSDMERFSHVRLRKDIRQLSDRLRDTFPKAAAAHPGPALEEFVRTGFSRFMHYGFGRKSILFTLLAWELHYGPNFERRDPDGTLGQLLMDTGPEKQRYARLKERMSALG